MPRLLTAVLAAAALAATALPGAAAAQTERGRVAFSALREGTRVVYTRNPDGTGLRLFRPPARSDKPAFSPRGRRLAFTRYGDLGAQVWISYLDGTGLRQLTSGPGDGMAAWAPTGEELVFARGRRGRRDLYEVVADGTGLRRLTLSRNDDHSPSWSVRGQIAFVRRTGAGDDVYVIGGPNGGPARRLTRRPEPDLFPSWSPTGRTLVFSRGRAGRRDLFVLRADGRRIRRLTRVRGDETEPTFSPDGTRVAFVHRRGRTRRLYIIKIKGRPIRRLPRRSLRVRRMTTGRSGARNPSWQALGFDPVIAAAGDIACDPQNANYNNGVGVPGACRQRLTSELLLRMDLDNVLIPGDVQYEDGQLWKFNQSFHPTWGRLKEITRPVPGNHEYRTPGAAGYFDYFNGTNRFTGPAGDRDKGYYSFDIGSWHVVALNSECSRVGGCGPASPQVQWLRADLARNPRPCTLAFWHHPRFTSGQHDDGGADVLPLWNVLYGANADLIINGHEHFYERFGPQAPSGATDPARGIRQITVGTGGRSHHGFIDEKPNSQVQDSSTLGVLTVALAEGQYRWELRRAVTGGRVDTGTSACH